MPISTYGSLGASVARLRPDLLPFAAIGALGYTLLHLLVMLVCRVVWRGSMMQWNGTAELPFRVFGLPAFELVWAGAFGMVWPLLVAHTCEVRFRRGR